MRIIRIGFDPEIALRAGYGRMNANDSHYGRRFWQSLTLSGFRIGLGNERRPVPDNANAAHNFPNPRPDNVCGSVQIVVGALTPAPDNENAYNLAYAPVMSLASNTIRPPFRS